MDLKTKHLGNISSIIKHDIYIYVALVGQTAGPIGLKFFVDTHG